MDGGNEEPVRWAAEPPPLPVMPGLALPPRPQVWGAWATLGLSAMMAIGYLMVQMLMVFPFMLSDGVFAQGPEGMSAWAEELEMDIAFLAWATIAGAVAGVPMVCFAAWLRRGLPVKDYLRLRWIGFPRLVFWVLVTGAFLMVADYGTREFADMSQEDEFMANVVQSAAASGLVPLMYVAFVVAAPLAEEFFFRGFLFEGLMRSTAGVWFANVFTAALWSIMHLQYGVTGMAMLFVAGLLFGYARVRTGSLVTPVVMHMVWNLVATIGSQQAFLPE